MYEYVKENTCHATVRENRGGTKKERKLIYFRRGKEGEKSTQKKI
jgi:hypothetical protein